MRAGIVGVGLLLVASGSWACGDGSDGDPPDLQDAGGGDDGSYLDGSVDPPDSGVQTAGLALRFGSDPALPGPLGGDPYGAFVEEMRVELQDLRAVGDSETGDNTTLSTLSLRWGSGGSDLRRGGQGTTDVEIRFPTAPPGYYSLIKADIMSYRARGTVEVDGGADFEIDDTPPTPISISIPLEDFLLEAGTSRTIEIHCSLHEAVGDVPWDAIDPGSDDLEIEGSDPEIAAVRAAMERSFTAAVLDQIE